MRARYHAVRKLTQDLVQTLSDADATLQSMEDASPAKWHLAHTSWFFETFILRDHLPGYTLYHERYPFLFNSYYEAEGARHIRAKRGMLTRPTLDEILAYRAHVDAHMAQFLGQQGKLPDVLADLVALGLNHEQQHQELMQTDILHGFAQNPLKPAIWPLEGDNGQGQTDKSGQREDVSEDPGAIKWITGKSGLVEIGHKGTGFAFDNELPRHEQMLHPHKLANRLITNGEWCAFIADGGYDNPVHWLADGWAWVQQDKARHPLHWQQDGDGQWWQYRLDGLHPLDPHAPVSHINLFEADAYASWAGARLPTEAEWEAAFHAINPDHAPALEQAGAVYPHGAAGDSAGFQQVYNVLWQWTGSCYRPYHGFQTAEGAVGEYNGKFMSGQFVLKGGSCATPKGHVRASYRNFFYPHQRWQFTGLRLAKDC